MTKSMRCLDYDDLLILELLQKGASRGQIAGKLCLSETAISTRVRKMGQIFMPIMEHGSKGSWRLNCQGFVLAAAAVESLTMLRRAQEFIMTYRRD